MGVKSFSTAPEFPVGGLTDVKLDQLTLTTGDVLSYTSSDKLWKNTPAGGGGNTFIDITQTNTDANYYPTFTDSAGLNKVLRCDQTAPGWSANPNTGEFLLFPTMKVGGAIANGRVAIGADSGTSSGIDATAVGHNAGGTGQSTGCVAVGVNAGQTLQGRDSLAVGNNAGNSGQNRGCIAIGHNTGSIGQMDGAISMGDGAGNNTQGTNSIAIGKNSATLNQPRNQVMLNASGAVLNTGTLGGDCFINTLKGFAHGLGVGVVKFDPITFELSYSTN